MKWFHVILLLAFCASSYQMAMKKTQMITNCERQVEYMRTLFCNDIEKVDMIIKSMDTVVVNHIPNVEKPGNMSTTMSPVDVCCVRSCSVSELLERC